MSSPSLMHETGHSKLVHWDKPDGWDAEGGGRGFQDGGEEQEGETKGESSMEGYT